VLIGASAPASIRHPPCLPPRSGALTRGSIRLPTADAVGYPLSPLRGCRCRIPSNRPGQGRADAGKIPRLKRGSNRSKKATFPIIAAYPVFACRIVPAAQRSRPLTVEMELPRLSA
jgi:hypothetical protein